MAGEAAEVVVRAIGAPRRKPALVDVDTEVIGGRLVAAGKVDADVVRELELAVAEGRLLVLGELKPGDPKLEGRLATA